MQDIVLTLKIYPEMELMALPLNDTKMKLMISPLLRPLLGSLHLFTLNYCGRLLVNFAYVRILHFVADIFF